MAFDNGRLIGAPSIRFKASGEERQSLPTARFAVTTQKLIREVLLDERVPMPTELTGSSWLEDVLASLAQARVAVFGDFCLDAYWDLDTEMSELSVETGLQVRRVRAQRYRLGGAGNVAANLVDLGVKSVRTIGVVGADLFGGELLRLLQARGVDTQDGMVVDPAWQTMVYAKPYAGVKEESRIDFGAFNAPADDTANTLMAVLEQAASVCKAVILNQQIASGVSSSELIERINATIAKFPNTLFVVDSRHRPRSYLGAVLKLNVREAALVSWRLFRGNLYGN